MGKFRTDIPADIKRAVREKSGFGCVICGSIPCDYDHIIDHNEVDCHEVDNLVLLCPMHHREKTNKRLSVDQVRREARNPFSLREEMGVGYAPFLEPIHTVEIGYLTYQPTICGRLFPIVVNNCGPICIEFAHTGLKISIAVRDFSGEVAFEMKENAFDFISGKSWDLTLEGELFTLRYKKRRIALQIRISEGKLSIEKLNLVVNKMPITIDQNGFKSISSQGTMTSISGISYHTKISGDHAIFGYGENSGKVFNSLRYVPEESWHAAWDLLWKKV